MFKIQTLSKSCKFANHQANLFASNSRRVFNNKNNSAATLIIEQQNSSSSSNVFRNSSINYKYASKDGLCLLPAIRSDREMTLVLDLDECLIASSENPFHQSFPCYPECHVMLRPGLEEFLVEMEKRYEIVLLTAGVKFHADNILKHMPDVFTHRLYRHHIFKTKRVNSLGRDMEKTIFLDNEISYLPDNLRNMLLMRAFYGNPQDKELIEVTDLLTQMAEGKGVSTVNIDEWNYPRCMEYLNRAQ